VGPSGSETGAGGIETVGYCWFQIFRGRVRARWTRPFSPAVSPTGGTEEILGPHVIGEGRR
jgi:hypothetical protein